MTPSLADSPTAPPAATPSGLGSSPDRPSGRADALTHSPLSTTPSSPSLPSPSLSAPLAPHAPLSRHPSDADAGELLAPLLCTSLADAARRLNAGGLLVYPTETFFGIGCRADRADAIPLVFAAKRRAPDMPLPLILASAAQLPLAASVAPELEADVARLAAFWPAPLTLLLPVRADLPPALTAGTGNVAVRVSAHPAARALAEACGFPVVSSSANISGRPAVTDAASLDPELLASLRPGLDGVFDARAAFPDAPPPGGGMASTIVEPLGMGRKSGCCRLRSLRVLREGALPLSRLAAAGFTILP